MNVVAVNGLESQAAKLLNFKEKLDVGLLDKVIASLYSGEGPQVNRLETYLNLRDNCFYCCSSKNNVC